MSVVPHISQLLKHFSFVFLPAAKSRMSCSSFVFSLVKWHGQWHRNIFFVGDLPPGSLDYGRCYLAVLEEFTSPQSGVSFSLIFSYDSSVLLIQSFKS